MYGEYLATRALALAVLGENGAAADTARQAAAASRSAEPRIFAAAVLALVSLEDSRQTEDAMAALLSRASKAGIWDSVVCVIRAAPHVLTSMERVSQHKVELRETLVRANEFTLASRWVKRPGRLTLATYYRHVR